MNNKEIQGFKFGIGIILSFVFALLIYSAFIKIDNYLDEKKELNRIQEYYDNLPEKADFILHRNENNTECWVESMEYYASEFYGINDISISYEGTCQKLYEDSCGMINKDLIRCTKQLSQYQISEGLII